MISELEKYKVILIGGSPMIGKTSLAVAIASELKYCCLSTDDIGESVRAFNKTKELNPMSGYDYREYYIEKSVKDLIRETYIQHRAMEKAIMRVISAHHDWGYPVVVEGWNLYPEFMSHFKFDDIISFYLVADLELFKKRILNLPSFYKGASNKKKLIENYLQRTKWHNQVIKKQTKLFNENTIFVNENDTTDDLVSKIKEILSK